MIMAATPPVLLCSRALRFMVPFRLVLPLAATMGCTASNADCDVLGRHFVELSIEEAKAEADGNEAVASIQIVAEEIAKELVSSCKAEPRRQREIDCLIDAASLDELEACSP